MVLGGKRLADFTLLLDLGMSRAIPDALRSAYDEARACLRAKAFTATAIMCRKTLKGVADQMELERGDLAFFSLEGDEGKGNNRR